MRCRLVYIYIYIPDIESVVVIWASLTEDANINFSITICARCTVASSLGSRIREVARCTQLCTTYLEVGTSMHGAMSLSKARYGRAHMQPFFYLFFFFFYLPSLLSALNYISTPT